MNQTVLLARPYPFLVDEMKSFLERERSLAMLRKHFR